MCFSAPASFTAAAFLGAAGVYSLSKVTRKKQIPLASFPLIFAIQQFSEGLVWLGLTGQISAGAADAPYCADYVFYYIANVLWPFLVPLSVLLIEPGTKRRLAMILPFIVGTGVSAHLLLNMYNLPLHAFILDHHIRYSMSGLQAFEHTNAFYLFAVSAPFLLTSSRWLMIFGGGLIASFILTNYFTAATYISVWCFFAAVLSLLLCLHFRKQHGVAAKERA